MRIYGGSDALLIRYLAVESTQEFIDNAARLLTGLYPPGDVNGLHLSKVLIASDL